MTGNFNRFDFNRDVTEGGSAGSTIIDLSIYDLTSLSVRKSITDTHWRLNAVIDGYHSLSKNMKTTTYSTTDHTGTSQMIFSGILPISRPRIKASENQTPVEGYDYGWYLSHNPIPIEYTHITASVNPATIITALLGGDDWETETGIEPYVIDNVYYYGTTLNAKTWDFEKNTTRQTVIDKLSAWCRFIWLVKWNPATGAPRAYFTSEKDIDISLELPAAVTFTSTDTPLQVLGEITYDIKGDAQYNKVIVYGRDSTGKSISSTLQSTDVTNKQAKPITYVESTGAFATQAQLDTRAAELFSYKASVIKVFTATLINRVDLEPLQKVRFTGFTGIDEDWCRITSIVKEIDGPMKKVTIEFTSDALFWSINDMYRESNPDEIGTIESVFDSKAAGMGGNYFGTVQAKDDNTKTATVVLDDGTITDAQYV